MRPLEWARDTFTTMAPGYSLAELRDGTGFRLGARFVEVEQRGITFTRGQVEAWVGHALTDDQVADIEEVAPNSSIPNAIEMIAHDALDIEYIETCAKCGRAIVEDGADGIWYHFGSGLPPCDPSQVDPDAYLDIEGDKYDIATPFKDGGNHDVCHSFTVATSTGPRCYMCGALNADASGTWCRSGVTL